MTDEKIRSFTDLNAWKFGHQLVLAVYLLTKNFPKDEQFGLTSQMRRCAVSITSNLAEGFGRSSYKEKIQFYSISQGSVREIQNQLLISRDIHYLDPALFRELAEKTVLVHKLINGLIKSSKQFILNS